MSKVSPIRYEPSLEKSIQWSKEWIKYYEPTTAKSDLDYIFDDGKFVKKYSTKPPADMTSGEILSDAQNDVDAYTTKVTKRIKSMEFDNESKILKKVSEELPDGETLLNLLMSYRLYDTVGKQRVRVPTSMSIKISNIDVKKQLKNKNSKNTNT